MSYRVEAKTVDRKGNPKRKFSFFGKTKQAAAANARDYFRKARNIKAGFYDEDGEFHRIRASSDYDPSRVGERSRRPKASRRKHNTRRRRRLTRSVRSTARRRTRKATNRRRVKRTVTRVRARRATNRRRKNKMPLALARYWRTHARTGKARNRRRAA